MAKIKRSARRAKYQPVILAAEPCLRLEAHQPAGPSTRSIAEVHPITWQTGRLLAIPHVLTTKLTKRPGTTISLTMVVLARRRL